MLSTCANPACQASFQYFREGRLYRFELSPTANGTSMAGDNKPPRKVEHFWLCGRCAAIMTLALHQQKVVVVRRDQPEFYRAVAS
jgi:hypothetical protein